MTTSITTGENKVEKVCGVPTVDQEIPDVITLNDKLIEELYLKFVLIYFIVQLLLLKLIL